MAAIGIIGGSGFYALLEDVIEKVQPENKYGKTSSEISIGSIGKRKVAFLARHGFRHEVPPHKINYRANILALKELGVSQIISATAVGSLKASLMPGDFVVPDQFVNLTHGRKDTFYDGPETTHISTAEPFCEVMRKILIEKCQSQKLTVHEKGAAAIVQGPRFSTKAESLMFRNNNWDIINMTMYPEMVLARELELCYANISLVTDYDTGLKDQPGIKGVTLGDVIKIFETNSEKLKQLILSAIPALPVDRACACTRSLEGARFSI